MKKMFVLIIAVLAGYGGYRAFIFFDNEFKYGRMWETAAIKPHEEPLLVMDRGVVPVDGGEAALKAAEASLMQSPFAEADQEILERGKELYSMYCAQCHGTYYDGNGTVGQSFHPLPGDLQSSKVQTMSERDIFNEISYGVPGGRQPALATTIAVLDRWRIIAFVKSLGPRT